MGLAKEAWPFVKSIFLLHFVSFGISIFWSALDCHIRQKALVSAHWEFKIIHTSLEYLLKIRVENVFNGEEVNWVSYFLRHLQLTEQQNNETWALGWVSSQVFLLKSSPLELHALCLFDMLIVWMQSYASYANYLVALWWYIDVQGCVLIVSHFIHAETGDTISQTDELVAYWTFDDLGKPCCFLDKYFVQVEMPHGWRGCWPWGPDRDLAVFRWCRVPSGRCHKRPQWKGKWPAPPWTCINSACDNHHRGTCWEWFFCPILTFLF